MGFEGVHQMRYDAIRCLQHCNALLLLVQTHASSATNTVAWRAGLLDSGRFLMIRCNGWCGALLAPVKHSVCLTPARQKGGPMGYPWAHHTLCQIMRHLFCIGRGR